MKLWQKKLLAITNVLALVMVVQSANSACCWVFHQPKFPEAAKKYCK